VSPIRRELWTVHLPAVAWLGMVTAALAVPVSPDLPGWVPRLFHFQLLDKVVHAAMFAVLGLLGVRSFRLLRVPVPRLAVLVAASAYAAASEVAQHLLTERSGEPADVLADVLGAAVGVAAAAMLRSGS